MPFDNTNRGALFVNDKQGNSARPDYRGDCNVDGVEYRVSGWKKQSKAGSTYLSLSFQKKDGQQAKPAPKAAAPADDFQDDEALPF
jgi:uncharacterized protein (DUF736 family)